MIVVFNETADKVLMCKRRKNPYKELLNFVGGKINPGEDSLCAAYRELEEETAIEKGDISLVHFMDSTYYLGNYCLEIYVGKLKWPKDVNGDENELYWIGLDNDFFDISRFAGDGNIGHIMLSIKMFQKELLE